MSRWSAIAGTIVFFFLAPGIVAGAMPWWISGWALQAPFAGYGAARVLGALLVIAGLGALVHSFARFALEGGGTPAPVAPTKRLVVGGLYRYVRNPMYLAVLAIIFGQALLFGSIAVAIYGVVVFLAVHIFVIAYEEPTLQAEYGADYDAYAANVARWLPRTSPWRPHP